MNKNTIQKLVERELWSIESFALLSCGFDPDNPTKDDPPENYYVEVNKARDRIREAAMAGQLDYIPEADPAKSHQAYGTDLMFKPINAIRWARSKKNLFPDFPNFPNLNESVGKGNPNNSLEDSEYWQTFKRQIEKAISEFPSWREKQGRASPWGDEQGVWLTSTIGLNTKTREVAKKVLRDVFDK